MEQNEIPHSDDAIVVSPEVYERLLASLDEPDEPCETLAEAARRKRGIMPNK